MKPRLQRTWPVWLGLLLMLSAFPGFSGDWYFKVDGVDGELTEGPLAGWTPIRSARFHMDPATNTFTCDIRKAWDRVSPILIQHCSGDAPLARVSLICLPDQPRAARYRLTLDDVQVTRVSLGGSTSLPEEPGGETVSLTFRKVESALFDLDPRGGTEGGLALRYDRSTDETELRSRPPFRIVLTRAEDRPGVIVSWPAEAGHRYRLLGCLALEQPWETLLEHTATEDGMVMQSLPQGNPALFLRVVEID